MKWRDMHVQGGRVSAGWQSAAWQLTVQCRNPNTLERCLAMTGPNVGDAETPEGWPDHWYTAEIANRMRQKARKAGAIKMTGKPRRWVFA